MPISDWTPSVDAVGAILRARTKDRHGNEVGTFNVDTRPTFEQATQQISIAVGDLANLFPEDLPVEVHDQARRLAAIGAAMLIELSFFPEQVATGRSPYQQLKDLYGAAFTRLQEAGAVEEDVTDESGAYGLPSYGFPEDVGGLVGWGSRF